MEYGFHSVDHQRMAGVMATLESNHGVGLICEVIDDLSLSFIAPLGTNHDYIATHDFPSTFYIPIFHKHRASSITVLNAHTLIADARMSRAFSLAGVLLFVRCRVTGLH